MQIVTIEGVIVAVKCNCGTGIIKPKSALEEANAVVVCPHCKVAKPAKPMLDAYLKHHKSNLN